MKNPLRSFGRSIYYNRIRLKYWLVWIPIGVCMMGVVIPWICIRCFVGMIEDKVEGRCATTMERFKGWLLEWK